MQNINRFCNCCNQEKILEDFPKSKDCSQGHRRTCKKCYRSGNGRNIQVKKLREEHLKKCSKCKAIKSFDEFYKQKSSKDGHMPRCKFCWKERNKIWAEKNIEKVKQMRKEYYEENKDKINKKTRKWEKNHRIEANAYRVERRKTDPVYKIKYYLRTRLYKIIKNKIKVGSFIRDLGCTVDFFVSYIAEKFVDGMSWDNRSEWHLDHIRPLASFSNLADRSQFLIAFHYTNYQPLWAADNLAKGSQWPSS